MLLLLLAAALLLSLIAASGAESAVPEYDISSLNYELVWADEFDTDGPPDPDRWAFDVGGSGWGNGELQYYMPNGNAIANNRSANGRSQRRSRTLA